VSPSDANDEGLESLVVVAVAVVSPSDANDEGLESLVVSRNHKLSLLSNSLFWLLYTL